MLSDEDVLSDASRMKSFHVKLPARTRTEIEGEAARLTEKLGVRVTAGAVARVALVRAMKEARKAATPQAAPQPIPVRERKRA